MAVLTLTVDDQTITAQDGDMIMKAIRDAGLTIPSLCHLDGASDVGACRLCLVEIAGSSKLQASCVTRAAEGMVIKTQTEKLKSYRRMILELLFAERNHVCSVCVANGHCELQDQAAEAGMDHIRYEYQFPLLAVDVSHERFGIDHNRCILCTRCVRVCDEIEGAHTWDLMGRGAGTRVITDMNQPWGDAASCTSCGKCVQACPTGALFRQGSTVAEMEHDKAKLAFIVTAGEKTVANLKLATVWLSGCSGCHMSFLDLDEFLIDLAAQTELVFSPLMDTKVYPEGVDVVLVEGAVANEENLNMIRTVRRRSQILVAFGDCTVTGNVTALRNPLGLALEVLRPVYVENGDLNARIPSEREVVPVLLDRVRPIHEVVKVDVFLQGCPPPAGRIKEALLSLLLGKIPVFTNEQRRFG